MIIPSDMPHAEQTIFASIWNYPRLHAGMAGRPWPKGIRQDCDETRSALTSVPYDGSDIGKVKARTSVLHHLFCVIGNGYGWENGRLVTHSCNADGSDSTEIRLKTKEEDEETELAMAEIRSYFSSDPNKTQPDWNGTRKFINELVRASGRYDIIYPMCEYSRLATIPDNITDDWIILAREAIQLVLGAKHTSREVDDKRIERCWHIARQAEIRLNEIEIKRK